MIPGMTPVCSSDHAEHSLHCPIFGTTEQCSAWTIQGFAPSRRPRLDRSHAERRSSHIISLRERVSIRETLSPLDEPSIFREKAKGGGRSGVAARRDAAATPPAPLWRRGYRLRGWSGFPDQTGLCETGGSSDPGGLRRGALAGGARMGYSQGHERRTTLARPEPEAAAATDHRRLRLALLHLPHDDQP